MNKIKMSTPKISLINNIRTPTNSSIKYTLEIAYLGTSIHLANQPTPTMAQVILSKEIKARIPDGSTMESSHVATLRIPGLRKQARQINI